MANGRQVYLRKREIGQIKSMVEWQLVYLDEELTRIKTDDGCSGQGHMHWAEQELEEALREAAKPIDQRLPDPEAERLVKQDRVARARQQIADLNKNIEDIESEMRLLRGIDRKMFYYVD